MQRTLSFVGIACLWSAVASAAGDSPSERMLTRLRSLEGDWEGTMEWSHGRTGSGTLKASYYVTGVGSAVVENLIMGDSPTMTSVYHLDGADLRMTHFCGARNQPRLKASKIDEAAGTAEFAFVDITNSSPKAGHVEHFFIHFLDPDHVNLVFTFGGGPGSGVENIVLKRVRPTKT